MKLHIIDPFLKNQSGHCFFYTCSVKKAAENKGVKTFIAGNIEPDATCAALPGFYPCLTEITNAFFENKGPAGKISALFSRAGRFGSSLEAFFFKNPDIELSKDDVVFVHTIYEPEFLALGIFFNKHRKIIEKYNVKIVILLRFCHYRFNFIYSLFFRLLYMLVWRFLLAGINTKVTICTDSELLTRDFEKILNTTIPVFPIPVYPVNFNRVDINSACRSGNNIFVSYLGAARHNKGFDVFVEMILNLTEKNMIPDSVFFIVQMDIQKQPPEDMRIVADSANKLRAYAKSRGNILLFEGIHSSDFYYSLLYESDIVVLPYRGRGFCSATSNVFVETVIFNKIPVVPQDTWMAHELGKYGVREPLFNPGIPGGLENTVKSCISSIETIKQNLSRQRSEYMVFHKSTRLVEMLLGQR